MGRTSAENREVVCLLTEPEHAMKIEHSISKHAENVEGRVGTGSKKGMNGV